MNWTAAGAIAMALGVALGAFGAHGLRGRLDAYLMGIYEKAVFYHFVHALGILIVSLLPKSGAINESSVEWVCGLLLGGIVVFSGSLYTLAITGNRALGAVTPIGGVAFIAGWCVLAWTLIRH